MVIDISKIESLVKNKSKYDPTLLEVRQALIYLKVNGIDPGKISDYESLIEIINDWQNIDLKYEKTIIGEIDKITKDGVVPDKYTLDGLIANYEKYLKTKPARIKFRTHVYELAAKAVSGKVVDKFKKELVDEAIKDIKSNNPEARKEEIEIEKERIEKKIEDNISGFKSTKKNEISDEKVGPESTISEKTPDEIKEEFTKTKDVDTWIKKNNLSEYVNEEQIDDLKKGLDEIQKIRPDIDNLKTKINEESVSVVKKIEDKLQINLPVEDKEQLINQIKISKNAEDIVLDIYDEKSVLKTKEKEIIDVIKKEYKPEQYFVEKTNQEIYEMAKKEMILENTNLKDNKTSLDLGIIDEKTEKVIEKVLKDKEVFINTQCDKFFDKYFEDSSLNNELFEENIKKAIENDKEIASFYEKNKLETDNYISSRIQRTNDRGSISEKMNEIFSNTENINSSILDKKIDLKTKEFIEKNNEIVSTHRWYTTDNNITQAIASENVDIKPYLENRKLNFDTKLSKETIIFKQKKILAAEEYSNFVKNTYHPNNLISDWGGSANWIKKYEIYKSNMLKNGLKIPYKNNQIINIDKFYKLLKSSPTVRFQINGGRYIYDLYTRLNTITFGGMTRMGMAEKFITLSTKLFGEVGGNFTAMWLNNFVKGATKTAIEKGFGNFLKFAGKEAIKKGAEQVIKTTVATAGKAVATTAVKTIAGGTLKGILATVGGAASGGIVTLVMAALEVLGAIVKGIKKLFKSFGIDLDGWKKWVKKNLGVSPGILMMGLAAVGGFIVGLPMFLMTMATVALAMIGPILGLVFGGIFIYQLFINQQVSSLVPPKEFVDKKESIIKEGCFVTRDGIRLRIIPINNDDICETNIDEPVCERKEEIMVYVGDKFCAASKEVCYLEKNVYEMYLQMIDAAVDELKEFDKLKVSYGYRDYDGQVRIWNDYCKNDYEKSCPVDGCDTGRAACPGSSSHQSGRAIDFNFETITEGGDFYRWLKDNAYKYGFKQTISYEPWHWEYTVKLFDGEKEECEDD
jgi:hypothetical protein